MKLGFYALVLSVGVLLSVLSVVAVVMILRIAEDVRVIRRRTDSSVKQPMEASKIIIICFVVSFLLCFVVLGTLTGGSSGNASLQGLF